MVRCIFLVQYSHKISKQLFKGHITEILSFLMSFLFLFKTILVLCLFLLLFWLLNFDFTIFTFWYYIKYFGNKLGISAFGQIGKTAFTAEFLTVANTLWIKTKPYSVSKAKPSFTDFFFQRILKLILKKHLVLYVERLGYKFPAVFVTFLCIFYFALQICVNLTMETRKNIDEVYIFSWNDNVWKFDILS